MAFQKHQEPFKQLSKTLDTLFDSYKGLKESLASLSENVFKIAKDPRDQATMITRFGKETQYNLKYYLKSLKDMSTAMTQENFSVCKEQADIGRDTIKELNDHIQGLKADDMLKALDVVVNELRELQQSKKEGSFDVDGIIEKELQGASISIKDMAKGLLDYIKKEMHQALDDSELFVSSDALAKEVEKVRETIPKVKKACNENILALGNIISTMDRLCKDGEHDETFMKSLKSNAEALRRSCDEKLPSVSASLEAIKHAN